jgi:hypothetical protein
LQIVSRWLSLKAIEQFASADWIVAVVPPELLPWVSDTGGGEGAAP